MSRRRVSCPLTAQQLWDAVKIIRYKRQVPDIERITRYMNRTHNVSDGKRENAVSNFHLLLKMPSISLSSKTLSTTSNSGIRSSFFSILRRSWATN